MVGTQLVSIAGFDDFQCAALGGRNRNFSPKVGNLFAPNASAAVARSFGEIERPPEDLVAGARPMTSKGTVRPPMECMELPELPELPELAAQLESDIRSPREYRQEPEAQGAALDPELKLLVPL